MEAVTLLGWDPLPSSVAASPYWESWADVKAKLATSLGEQKALNGGDSWCVSVLWTGGDSWSGLTVVLTVRSATKPIVHVT